MKEKQGKGDTVINFYFELLVFIDKLANPKLFVIID